MHDPKGTAAFVTAFEERRAAKVEYHAVSAPINDAAFSDAVLAQFDRWVAQGLIAADS